MKRSDDIARASRELVEPLRGAPIGISSPAQADAERARLLPEIATMVRRAPRLRAAAKERRRFRRYALAAAAAVLAVGAGTAVQWTGTPAQARGPAQPGTTVVEGRLNVENEAPLVEGSRFVGEAAIETPRDASARLVTESGVEVVLLRASRARLHPTARRQRVDLVRGEVSLNVPELGSGASVAVVTPDATVTVHGTRFSVSYDATAPRPSTCVRVLEGTVSVDRSGGVETLRAGQSSGCDETDAPPASLLPPSEPRALPHRGARTASRATGSASTKREAPATARAGARPTGPASTLEQENELLLTGLAAERRHDDDAAKAALGQLLTRYPRSPLVEEAKAALSRIESRR